MPFHQKIYIHTGKQVSLGREVVCVISFTKDPPRELHDPKRRLICVDAQSKFERYYQNFPSLSVEIERALYRRFFQSRSIIEELRSVILLGLNYRSHKLNYLSYKYHSFSHLLREVSALIKAHYHYYSISCAILCALMLSQVGLPNKLPKILDNIYGLDFMDDIFFPVAFVFTALESTNDLLLREENKDPLYIARAFISFLLWKGAKPLLKIPYYKLLQSGVSKEMLWITL